MSVRSATTGRASRAEGWLPARYLGTSAVAALIVGLVLGIPTDVIPNPWFTRMIAAEPFNYFFWISTSLLTGALLATYLLPRHEATRGVASAGFGSGTLGLLAVGCPICNKLIVTLLGVSGALNYFAPLQPLLGGLALALAGAALLVRLRTARRACAVQA